MKRKVKLFMDTVVDIQAVAGSSVSETETEARIDRAFEAFRQVESACSRFSPDSELMTACRQVGIAVPVSPFLFEPLKFALALAEWTEGVFDPTIGRIMETHGFNRHYLTKQTMHTPAADNATYQDIVLNEQDRTLTLHKPLVIDLGAVAKGFAIDLAANELKGCSGFIVNAGGDLYAGGVGKDGNPWPIDIQHPADKERIIHSLELTNAAICTSGSYERRSTRTPGIHHLIDPLTGQSPNNWVSVSVIAPYAMMADAFSTAAFLLDAEAGQALLEDAGLQGLLITSDLQLVRVGGMN